MLAHQLKKISEQGNLDRSVVMLVHEYFGNCVFRYLIVGVVNFMENCSILVCKPYDIWQLFVYDFGIV